MLIIFNYAYIVREEAGAQYIYFREEAGALYLTMQYIYSQGGGWCYYIMQTYIVCSILCNTYIVREEAGATLYLLLYLTMQYIYSQGGGWCSLYLTMQYIYRREEAGAHYI